MAPVALALTALAAAASPVPQLPLPPGSAAIFNAGNKAVRGYRIVIQPSGFALIANPDSHSDRRRRQATPLDSAALECGGNFATTRRSRSRA